MFLSRIWLICRVCMKQSDGMVNLFAHISELPVWNLLRDCGGIPVRKNDNLPDKICETCLERLWMAHAFRLDCQKSHRDITHLVQPKRVNEKGFLLDLEPEKTSLVDRYLTEVIDNFEAEKVNGYLDSTDSESISKTQSNSATASIVNKPPTTNYTNEEGESQMSYPMINGNKTNCGQSLSNSCVDWKKKQSKLSQRPRKKMIVLSYRSSKWSTRNARDSNTISKKRQRPRLAYGCKICKNIYASRELLRHHMYTHIKPHICKLCGKTFGQKQQFTNHMNSHSGRQPYPCRFCSKSFGDTSNRNKHERNIHKNELTGKQANTTECYVCEKTFTSVAGLRSHHRKVHLKSLDISKPQEETND